MRVDPARVAAGSAAGGLAGIAGFQAALAFGAPWGRAAWGGASTRLPPNLRVGSAVSAFVLAGAALVVRGRAGQREPEAGSGLLRWATWALVPLLALSALGNFASASKWENRLMGPLALLLAGLCAVVARRPGPFAREQGHSFHIR